VSGGKEEKPNTRDAEGIITCPLHGLLIDPATETVVG
jgi:hypothetical protein